MGVTPELQIRTGIKKVARMLTGADIPAACWATLVFASYCSLVVIGAGCQIAQAAIVCQAGLTSCPCPCPAPCLPCPTAAPRHPHVPAVRPSPLPQPDAAAARSRVARARTHADVRRTAGAD
jgi:hypothetical protein